MERWISLAAMADSPEQEPSKRDERVAIALDPEAALRALLKVDPAKMPPPKEDDKDGGD